MKISILFPSRQRARKSHETAVHWIENIGAGVDYELILSIDRSDDQGARYKQQHRATATKILHEPNESLVEATNRAAEASTGDILLYLSDDFACFPDWGNIIIREFEKYPGVPILIKIDDMLQPFKTAVLTMPIMNRMCYQGLGYFFHPAYKSMFVDEQLYWRTSKLGFLKMAPRIKFEHKHVSVGKAPDDQTYRRSAANWGQGKAQFAIHKQDGFVE